MTDTYKGEYIYLSAEDLNTLEDFRKVTRLVDDLYNKLQKLALENQENTPEFQKLLTYLPVVLDLENARYLKANLKEEDVYNYITYITEKNDLADSSDVDTVLAGDFEKRIYRRMIIKILELSPDNKKIRNTALAEDLQDYKSTLKVTPEINSDLLHDHIIEYIKALNEDIYYLFLGLLQTISGSVQLKETHDDLIATFYNLLFVIPELEIVAIKNNFQFAHTIENKHQKLAENPILNPEDYLNLTNNHCYDVAFNWALAILGIPDELYSEPYYISRIDIYQCLIKSALMFCDVPTIIRLKNDLATFINTPEFQTNFANNKYSINITLSLTDTILEAKKEQNINLSPKC